MSLLFFIVSHLLLVSLAHEENDFNSKCPPFACGDLGNLTFPFSSETHPECGLLRVADCNDKEKPTKILLGKDPPYFYVTGISQDNSLTLRDQGDFVEPSGNRSCDRSIRNFTISRSPFFFFEVPAKQFMYKCPYDVPKNIISQQCNDSKHVVGYPKGSSPPSECEFIQFWASNTQKGIEFQNLYTGWFRLRVIVKKECAECNRRRGQCQTDSKGKFKCANAAGDEKLALKLGLGLGIGIGALTVLIVILCIWFTKCHKKRKHNATSFHSSYTSPYPSSTLELEVGSVCFEVAIFSYSELAEATHNFSNEKELGDGGFGTVYYAKLRDGREVAVKRLHEHNYGRVKQFMNEIEILTCLRHKNLVSLYGCSSWHSQQSLLLVYEYIPNGTVADHLHGDRVNSGSLTWPIRMNIAIETASALVYLHASGIIHRDVKTNNILLDNNFCVKVADFGLSRLFPTNVTHISTAPQGSPGYVDPEYHQCYLLTDKSDVYSFGVVLIELISSMPAVDITRHRNEINLANLAINRIRGCAIDELIDPCLGYHTDEEVKRMTTSVAELAFLCLQQIREMRPSMYAVLEELKRIKSGGCKLENKKEGHDENEELKRMQPTKSPPECENLALLKHIRVPSSPIPVTAKRVNSHSSPDVNG